MEGIIAFPAEAERFLEGVSASTEIHVSAYRTDTFLILRSSDDCSLALHLPMDHRFLLSQLETTTTRKARKSDHDELECSSRSCQKHHRHRETFRYQRSMYLPVRIPLIPFHCSYTADNPKRSFLLHYPMHAFINLFVHTIRFPRADTVHTDLALLDVAAGYFGQMDFVTGSELSFPFTRDIATLARDVVDSTYSVPTTVTADSGRQQPFEATTRPTRVSVHNEICVSTSNLTLCPDPNSELDSDSPGGRA